MNYMKKYNAIIANAQNRVKPDCYTEEHHIIPRSEGGSNDASNIVTLTAKEHFMVHWLLYKDDPTIVSRTLAFKMMCDVDPSPNKTRHKASAKTVALLKEVAAKQKSELYKTKCWVHKINGEKLYILKSEIQKYISDGWIAGSGRTLTEEQKEHLRQHNLSKPKPGQEFRDKMSAIVKETYKNKPESWNRSPETIEKLRVIAKDKWNDPERASRMASKSRSTCICPHCGKEGSAVVMPRWHFDNCKHRKQ